MVAEGPVLVRHVLAGLDRRGSGTIGRRRNMVSGRPVHRLIMATDGRRPYIVRAVILVIRDTAAAMAVIAVLVMDIAVPALGVILAVIRKPAVMAAMATMADHAAAVTEDSRSAGISVIQSVVLVRRFPILMMIRA